MTTPVPPDMDRMPPSVRDGLACISAAAVGPFGPTPLRQLVAGHLALFAELRRLGAAWSQIAALIAAHGVLARDAPVGVDVLRATYASVCTAAKRNETQRNVTQHNEMKGDAKQRSNTQHNESERKESQCNETECTQTKHCTVSRNDARPEPHSAMLDDVPRPATVRNAAAVERRHNAKAGSSPASDDGSSLRIRAKLLNVPTRTR